MSDTQARRNLAARLAPTVLAQLDPDRPRSRFMSPTKDLSFVVVTRDPVDIDAAHPETHLLQTFDANGAVIETRRVDGLTAAADRIALAVVDEISKLREWMIAATRELDLDPLLMR